MEIRVTIFGVPGQQEALEAIMRPAAMVQALTAAALYVEGQAKIKAPIDTGFLRNSIGVGQVTANFALVGTNANYASYVEEGTTRMEARPYMRPALTHNAQRLSEIVRSVLEMRARR